MNNHTAHLPLWLVGVLLSAALGISGCSQVVCNLAASEYSSLQDRSDPTPGESDELISFISRKIVESGFVADVEGKYGSEIFYLPDLDEKLRGILQKYPGRTAKEVLEIQLFTCTLDRCIYSSVWDTSFAKLRRDAGRAEVFQVQYVVELKSLDAKTVIKKIYVTKTLLDHC